MRVLGPAAAVVLGLGLFLGAAREAGAGEGPKGPVEDGEAPKAIGKVWVYKKSRKVIAPGRVCLQKGPLEYFACFQGGKDHESVVAGECNAETLNLAFIAMNYKALGGVKQVGDPEAPEGDPVFIHVEWEEGKGDAKKKKRVRAEELAFNVRTKKHMRNTAWIYTGSRFFKDKRTGKDIFGASVTGVLAAVYRDPYAIFNSPLDTGADDIYYEVNHEVAPPRGTRVYVIFAPAKKEDVKFEDGADLPAPEGAPAPPAGEGPEAKPAPPPGDGN